MFSIMRILGWSPKAVGPLLNVVGHVPRASVDAALAEIGAPSSWPAVKRDKHRKLKQGRSLILRNYTHRDTAMRKRMPAVEELVQQVLSLGYGSVPGKIVVACLPPGKVIKPHYDVGGYYKFHNRIHVPLCTAPDCRMQSAAQTFHMEVGNIYLFQNLEVHSAHNASSTDRLHLIVDVLDERYSASIYRRTYLLLASNFGFAGSLYRLWAALWAGSRVRQLRQGSAQ